MENIDSLFKMQRAHYTSAQAYDTFCDELENYLPYVFGLTKAFPSWSRMLMMHASSCAAPSSRL